MCDLDIYTVVFFGSWNFIYFAVFSREKSKKLPVLPFYDDILGHCFVTCPYLIGKDGLKYYRLNIATKIFSLLPLEQLVLEEFELSLRFHYFHKFETKMGNRNMLPLYSVGNEDRGLELVVKGICIEE
jgi:protein associated with RNAse G/E